MWCGVVGVGVCGGGGGGDSGLQAAVFVLDSDRYRFCYDGTKNPHTAGSTCAS